MEEKEKIRVSKRFRYTEYYSTESRTDPSGKLTEAVVYKGPYMKPEHTGEQYSKSKAVIRGCAAVNAVCVILLLAVRGYSVYSGGEYAFVPAVAALIPAMYFLLGAFKLPKSDRLLQKDCYELGHIRIQRSSISGAVLLALSAVLSAVFFIAGKVKPAAVDVLFVLLLALGISAGILSVKTVKSLKYSKE